VRGVRLSAIVLATVFALLDLATPVSAATSTPESTFSVTTTYGTEHTSVHATETAPATTSRA